MSWTEEIVAMQERLGELLPYDLNELKALKHIINVLIIEMEEDGE